MTYKNTQLPIELKEGDIVLYRSEFELLKPMTLLSGAIRYFTQYPYNHCAVVVNNNGELFLNEALIGGITARPLDQYLYRGNKTYIAVIRPKAPVTPIEFSRQANKYVGSKYDVTALVFHHSVYRIPKLLGYKGYGEWQGSTGEKATSKLVCSEYAALVHNVPQFWLMSTREVVESGYFDLIWEEKKLL